MSAVHPLDALEQALHDERNALLAHDVDALLRSTQAKLEAIRHAQSLPAEAAAGERVNALSEMNRANGALLARRRREVSWSLRHLGRIEADTMYDASGQSGARLQARCLGVG
ncbi:flagellar protein FlgN [Lysobacter niastensis]|uniref:Flagellar protein FlgN n=1 Tax=Lysobacter niastensis TaxID=380629 RepID=A0ABS0BCB6_9GAMM|nr:flagellar protein FlgN [Lysobacter niastensis]MBF6025582.1 flagellar protein FlgN [Lysobacter niastensis]